MPAQRPPAQLPKDHPPVKFGKIGIVLINLGTPEATSYWPMRRYLKEFLSDRRVIETNRVLWWLILNGIVLTTRPKSSGHAYDQIWNKELDESPLKTITRNQAEAIAAAFAGDDRFIVDWAMRYGLPSTKEVLDRLAAQGCERIVLFPLYPQYAAATTATALDKAFDALKQMRWQPTIRTVPPYFDEPAYIDGLGRQPQGAPGQPVVETGCHHRLVPRSSQGVPSEGRPLSLPIAEDCPVVAREDGHVWR